MGTTATTCWTAETATIPYGGTGHDIFYNCEYVA